jgi:hypothetical protein
MPSATSSDGDVIITEKRLHLEGKVWLFILSTTSYWNRGFICCCRTIYVRVTIAHSMSTPNKQK